MTIFAKYWQQSFALGMEQLFELFFAVAIAEAKKASAKARPRFLERGNAQTILMI